MEPVMPNFSGFEPAHTPTIAIRLAQVPEVDLLVGLGAQRHAAVLRLGTPAPRRWIPLTLSILAALVLAAVAFGPR
jgi:hypothetical protein